MVEMAFVEVNEAIINLKMIINVIGLLRFQKLPSLSLSLDKNIQAHLHKPRRIMRP